MMKVSKRLTPINDPGAVNQLSCNYPDYMHRSYVTNVCARTNGYMQVLALRATMQAAPMMTALI